MTCLPGEPLSDQEPDRSAHAGFTHVRWREGYAIGEVDAFIELAVAALDSPSPALRPEDVRAARFRPVRVREGYEMAEVDAYLDDLEEQLAKRHPTPEEEPSPEVRPSLLGLLTAGTWTSRLTWVLLLAVLLLWVYAELLRPHWAGS